MNQAQIVLRVRDAAKAAGIKVTKDKVDFIFREILKEIENGLLEDGVVKINFWGRFKLRKSNATHYDIQTRQVVDGKGTNIVTFKSGRRFKDALNHKMDQ